jgi:hypothetical protein
MRLTLLASFDLGLSVGIDDTPFADDNKVAEFAGRIGALVERVAGLPRPFGLDLPAGWGLRVDLLHHELLRSWVPRAQEIVERGHDKLPHWAQRDAAEVVEKAKALLRRCTFSACYLDIYSLGVAFLRIDLGNVPADHADVLIRSFQSFEYAAYDVAGPFLKEVVGHFMAVFRNETEFEEASRRSDFQETPDADLLPGFTFAVTCDGTETDQQREAVIRVMQDFEGQERLRTLPLDEAVVHLGGVACVVVPRQPDYERAFWLLQIALVDAEVCGAFERLFTRHMRETVRAELVDEAPVTGAAALNNLRTLALAITQLTSFSSTTANVSDLYLFAAFDQLAKVSERHARIRRTSEVFYNLQSELGRQVAERRGKLLSLVLFLISAVIILSVTADVLGVLEKEEAFKPHFSERTWWLVGVFILVLVAAGVSYWFGDRLDRWWRAVRDFFRPTP